jgi:hypothetical protein
MIDQALKTLLDQAVAFLARSESGNRPAFPQWLVQNLLSAEVTDGWHGGLYLASRLPRTQIRERFFPIPGTYRSLATYLAAGCAAYAESRGLESFGPQYQLEYLLTRWNPPTELLERTLEEYSSLEEQLKSRDLADEKHGRATTKSLAIIVHGTWAAKEAWWRPKAGAFWYHIEKTWPHLYSGPSPFVWSGDNKHAARAVAAEQLVKWAQSEGSPALDIIAHSHGGNVCLLASRLGLRINRLVLLGTPIRTEYMLDLGTIGSIRNVFSLADHTQTSLGTTPNRRFEGRTLGDSANVSNWRAEHDGTGGEPGHSDLHEPATWIASALDKLLA